MPLRTCSAVSVGGQWQFGHCLPAARRWVADHQPHTGDACLDGQPAQHVRFCGPQVPYATGGPVPDGQMRYDVVIGAAIGQVSRKGSRHRLGSAPGTAQLAVAPARAPAGRTTRSPRTHSKSADRSHRIGQACDHRGGDRRRRHERVQDTHVRGHTPGGGTVEPAAVTADSPLSFWHRDQDSTFCRHGPSQRRIHSPSSPGTAATIAW
jgi:hypothetical protein